MIVQKIEVTGIEDVEKRLGNLKSKAPLVVARAINRATTNAKKNMAKETSGKYFVSSGDVKNRDRPFKVQGKSRNTRPVSRKKQIPKGLQGRS